MSPPEIPGFLPNLTDSFSKLDAGSQIATPEFVSACSKVLPIFDHIGTVFFIAKHEFSSKLGSIERIAPQLPTLDAIVADGRARGDVTVKNSPARNLHRLANTLAFISAIFKGLLRGLGLKEAVTEAYDATLGLLHSWVVRQGIRAGTVGLPSRAAFLKSIGETDASAAEHARHFIGAADALVESMVGLYDGVEMPKSDFSVSALWGK